jgi:hypothetical protein
MRMKAFGLRRTAESLERVIRRQAELRAVVSRADRLVRVCLDPRRDADQGARNTGLAGPVDLLQRIEDDERVRRGRHMQLLVGLVVAVRDEPRAGNAGLRCEPELAQRRDVRSEPLLREQAQDLDVGERFRPVTDERIRRRFAVRPRLRAQGCVVVDDERAAVLAQELGGGDPADHEGPRFYAGRVRQEVEHRPILPVDEK